jgi:hypothetical protein
MRSGHPRPAGLRVGCGWSWILLSDAQSTVRPKRSPTSTNDGQPRDAIDPARGGGRVPICAPHTSLHARSRFSRWPTPTSGVMRPRGEMAWAMGAQPGPSVGPQSLGVEHRATFGRIGLQDRRVAPRDGFDGGRGNGASKRRSTAPNSRQRLSIDALTCGFRV